MTSEKPIQNEIEQRLKEVYVPIFLDIENESDAHSGPKGRESHFKVFIVSKVFEGLKLLDRQKHIYQTLKDLMPKIHALALRTLTEDQWKKDQKSMDKSEAVEAAKNFKSPNCTHKPGVKN